MRRSRRIPGLVNGTVSYKGQPLSIGFVTLVGEDGKKYSANIQANGKYALTQGVPINKNPKNKTQGVPVGTYKVLIEEKHFPAERGAEGR